MKKKLTALALVVVMVAMLFTGLTMAYFTDTETVANTFTVGDVGIDVFENGLKPDTDGDGIPELDDTVEVEENEYEEIVPGAAYPKNPTIENTGTNDAYVRMLVTIPVDVFNAVADAGVTDLGTIFRGYDAQKWIRAAGPVIENETVTYIYNYADVLSNGESATLFTAFKLPESMTQEDLMDVDEFYIKIKGEAIQADGFADRQTALATLAGLNLN